MDPWLHPRVVEQQLHCWHNAPPQQSNLLPAAMAVKNMKNETCFTTHLKFLVKLGIVFSWVCCFATLPMLLTLTQKLFPCLRSNTLLDWLATQHHRNMTALLVPKKCGGACRSPKKMQILVVQRGFYLFLASTSINPCLGLRGCDRKAPRIPPEVPGIPATPKRIEKQHPTEIEVTWCIFHFLMVAERMHPTCPRFIGWKKTLVRHGFSTL